MKHVFLISIVSLITACGGASQSDLFDPVHTSDPQEASSADAEVSIDAGADAREGNLDAPAQVEASAGQTTCVLPQEGDASPFELTCTAAMCAATGISPWELVDKGSWVGCCSPVGAVAPICRIGDPCRVTDAAGNVRMGTCQ